MRHDYVPMNLVGKTEAIIISVLVVHLMNSPIQFVFKEKVHPVFSTLLFQTTTQAFSLPMSYIVTRRYFVVGANCLSMILLAFGILILLGNRFVTRNFILFGRYSIVIVVVFDNVHVMFFMSMFSLSFSCVQPLNLLLNFE